MQTVEDHLNLDIEDETIIDADDTITIFKGYINQLELDDTKKDKLEKTILSLYSEAVNII